MILENIAVGIMQVNCYVLAKDNNSEAIIIDPGDEYAKIALVLNKHKLTPALVINTHGHYDHIGSDDKFGVAVYIHQADAEFLKNPRLNLSGMFALSCSVKSEIKTVQDKELIVIDGVTLEAIHIPGHTPGGVALLMKKPQANILFSGDTLFYHGIGRSDLAGSDEALLIKSIQEKLLTLPLETIVYPGHGPSTTIKEEKKNNPFLS
jgi:glyoxylase-like metal-dependent hydrolase (beta-lactamase superfamily II)